MQDCRSGLISLFRASRQQHRVFGQRLPLVARLRHEVNDQGAVGGNQESNAINEQSLARETGVGPRRHGEESFLRQTHQARSDGQNEAQQAEEDVNGHVKHPYRLLRHREKVAREADDVLARKDDDSEKSDPGMQRVEVRNRRLGVVVRVERGPEPIAREEEGEAVDRRMRNFQTPLAAVAEASVY